MTEHIDSHVHLWHRATDPQPWVDPATMPQLDRDFDTTDLAQMLDQTGQAEAVVVQSTNSAEETHRLLLGAGTNTRVRGVVGWLDLTADVPAQLDALTPDEQDRLLGIRHLVHVDEDPRWLERSDVGHGLRHLAEADLGFDLVVRPWQLPLAFEVAARPGAPRFVVDHLGGAADMGDEFADWARNFAALAKLPNVCAKISGQDPGRGAGNAAQATDTDPDAVRRLVDVALESFGPERLMYGSDWPLTELRGGATAWSTTVQQLLLDLSDSEQDAVLSGTARSYYRLPGDAS